MFLYIIFGIYFYIDIKIVCGGGGVNFIFLMIIYFNYGKFGYCYVDVCGLLGIFIFLYYDILGIYWKDINVVW